MPPPRRLVALVAALFASAAAVAAAAPAKSGPVRFVSAPRVVRQGKVAHVAVAASKHGFVQCSLAVSYKDGDKQAVGSGRPSHGLLEWTWQVPEVATPGPAKLTVSCDRVGRASRSVKVVGDLVPPKIQVEKEGFSIRPTYNGSNASFGVLLKNLSPNADALQVYVLVNLVMADGHVLGTSSSTVDAVAAGGTYAYGGSLRFPGAAPIVRLEVAVQIGGRQRHAIYQPLAENVRVLPGRNDATWVGEVDGELINDNPSLNVRSSKLSTVVFDSGGNVIGGGIGSASALLPPGTREAFVIRTGVDAIPWARAASATVSPVATYTP